MTKAKPHKLEQGQQRMTSQPEPRNRRQLAVNFSRGDQIRIGLFVEGTITRTEQKPDGDWLLSMELNRVESRALESARDRVNNKAVERVRPVLWSVTSAGEVEFVIDIGARQRLLTLGISEKQKQVLRKNLANLPAAEAAELLREISGSPVPPKYLDGATDRGSEREAHDE